MGAVSQPFRSGSDTIRGGARQRARKLRHSLVFGRSLRIGTMMQSCASAAKLRGSGPNLHSGLGAMVLTSGHRYLGFIGRLKYGLPSRLFCYSVLMTPD